MLIRIPTEKYNWRARERQFLMFFLKNFDAFPQPNQVNVPDGCDTIAIRSLSVLLPVAAVDDDRPPTNQTKRARGTIVAAAVAGARVLGRRPRPRSSSGLTVYGGGGGGGGIRFSVRKNNIGKKK